MTPSLFVLRGILDIPWGYIELKEHLLNINISFDAVIVDNSTYDQFVSYEDLENTFDITMSVIVRIGNNVRIHAFGIG